GLSNDLATQSFVVMTGRLLFGLQGSTAGTGRAAAIERQLDAYGGNQVGAFWRGIAFVAQVTALCREVEADLRQMAGLGFADGMFCRGNTVLLAAQCGVELQRLGDPVDFVATQLVEVRLCTQPLEWFLDGAADAFCHGIATGLCGIHGVQQIGLQLGYPGVGIQHIGEHGHLSLEESLDALLVTLGGLQFGLGQVALILGGEDGEIQLGNLQGGLFLRIVDRQVLLLGEFAEAFIAAPDGRVIEWLAQVDAVTAAVVEQPALFILLMAAAVGVAQAQLGQQASTCFLLALLRGLMKGLLALQHGVLSAGLDIETPQVAGCVGKRAVEKQDTEQGADTQVGGHASVLVQRASHPVAGRLQQVAQQGARASVDQYFGGHAWQEALLTEVCNALAGKGNACQVIALPSALVEQAIGRNLLYHALNHRRRAAVECAEAYVG